MTERRREDEKRPLAGHSDERPTRDFSSRLKKARKQAGLDTPPQQPAPPLGLASYALRLATELVAGVIVGGFIGWWIDKLAGTSPFGLIACFALGFTAGMFNVVRAVKKLNAQQASLAASKPPDEETLEDELDKD